MIPIDAPVYPPAAAFEQPVVAPRPLSVRSYTVAELMQQPAAWAVVVKHMPGVKLMVSAEQAKPMMSTMTLADLGQFTGGAPKVLDAIDAELAQLPQGGGR